MPNGITAAIYEGKDVSLRDYLMRVGRSMSLAIMQREENQDAPVRRREVSQYERDHVTSTRAELVRLRQMTPEQAGAGAEREFIEATASYEKTKADKAALRERYDAMLAEVEAWEPNPKVMYVKEHAIKYLRESMDFDLSKDGNDMTYYSRPVRLDGARWLAERTAQAKDAFDRAVVRLDEEIVRVADFNEHIEAFLESLPPEKVTA